MSYKSNSSQALVELHPHPGAPAFQPAQILGRESVAGGEVVAGLASGRHGGGMHLKVQEAVGAESQDVFTFIPSWVYASHQTEPCGGEGGSLGGGHIKK